MSADGSNPEAAPELQFDRAVPAEGEASPAAQPAVVCSSCGSTISLEYFSLGDQPLCQACKDTVQKHAAPVREWQLVSRASLFGFGAAIAGAILYYGVIAITDLEIGIVAIVIGFMVGFAVRKGARGRGGRRLQVMAAALTYLSVALAYVPIAMKGVFKSGADVVTTSASTVDSAGVLPSAPAAAPNEPGNIPAARPSNGAAKTGVSAGGVAVGLLALIGLALALPVMVVFGSLPSGLISGLIIGFGIRQAWKMTGAPELAFRGPYKVGRPPTAAGSAPDGPNASA